MTIVVAVLSILLALGIAASGLPKILARPAMADAAEHLGYSVGTFRVVGLLEVSAAIGLTIGLWWNVLGIAAATGLIALILGALVAHLRAKDKATQLAPAAILGLLALSVLILHLVQA